MAPSADSCIYLTLRPRPLPPLRVRLIGRSPFGLDRHVHDSVSLASSAGCSAFGISLRTVLSSPLPSSSLPIGAAPTHVLINRPTRGGTTARRESSRERGDRPAGVTGLSIRGDRLRGEVVDSRSVPIALCTRTRQGTSFPTTPVEIPFTSSR